MAHSPNAPAYYADRGANAAKRANRSEAFNGVGRPCSNNISPQDGSCVYSLQPHTLHPNCAFVPAPDESK